MKQSRMKPIHTVILIFALLAGIYAILFSIQLFEGERLPFLFYLFGLRPKYFLVVISVFFLMISFILSDTPPRKKCSNATLILFSLSFSLCICEFYLDRQSMRAHLMPQRIASIESKYEEEGVGFRFPSQQQTFQATLPDVSIPWFSVDAAVHQTEQSNIKIALDQHGFRNPNANTPYDLVILGDSFVLSAEQPDGHTWIDIASRELGMNAYNMGTGGFGVSQSIKTYLRHGSAVKHWGLVLCINGINDLVDEENYLQFLQSGLSVKAWAYRSVGQAYPVQSFMIHHYFRALTTQIQIRKIGFLEKPPMDISPVQTCINDQCKQVAYYPHYFRIAHSVHKNNFQNDKPFLEMKQSIQLLQAHCRENDIKLAVLYFPAKFTIHPPQTFNDEGWAACLQYFLNENIETVASNSAQFSQQIINADFLVSDEFEAFCNEQFIPFKSTIEDLQEYSRKNNEFLYYSYDIHWNRLGNACIGESVSNWLKP